MLAYLSISIDCILFIGVVVQMSVLSRLGCARTRPLTLSPLKCKSDKTYHIGDVATLAVVKESIEISTILSEDPQRVTGVGNELIELV